MESRTLRLFGLPLGDWFSEFVSPKYLPMGLAIFVAMFAALQFVLLLFNAASTTDRWVFELTPAFLGNLPDLQLAFLSALAAGGEAYLQYGTDPQRRTLGMVLAGLMAAGLVLGLYEAGSDPTGSNVMRMVSLGMVLGIVVMDHRSILGTPARAREVAAVPEPEAAAAPAVAPEISDTAVVDELLDILAEETGILTEPKSTEEEIAGLEALTEEAEAVVHEEEQKEEVEAEEEAEFALQDLETFETWLDEVADKAPEEGATTGKATSRKKHRLRLRTKNE